MAADRVILDALLAMEEKLLELKTFADTLGDLTNGDGPDSPQVRMAFIVGRHVDRAVEAAEAVGVVVRQYALPILADMATAGSGRRA